jgi:hypothetical protein
LIDIFDAFNVSIFRLSPLEHFEPSRFVVELIYRPSLPDNISNWEIFECDEYIIEILTNGENLKDLDIDD